MIPAAPTPQRRRGGRRFIACSGLLVAGLAVAWGSDAPPSVVQPTTDRAARATLGLERALAFLMERQDDDGAWRSETYGFLRDGASLTPSVAKAVLFGASGESSRGACDAALDYVASFVTPEGVLDAGPQGLHYPVYTAALAVTLLVRADDPQRQLAARGWEDSLRSFQLVETLGWSPEDPAYGGWGYSRTPPQRQSGRSGDPYDADLSSTLFAVGALRMAGAADDDPAVRAALQFVQRCQNFGQDGEFDDGGFHFTPTNSAQNKAGEAGVDASGRTRYRSYGSMTADGLRALLRCGLSPEHPRVVAAHRWLEGHFRADKQPGAFPEVREVERASSYYYWCWSFAHAMRMLGTSTLDTPRGQVVWAQELTDALLARQATDGSWSNPCSMVLEDDPLIATPFAAAALGLGLWFLEAPGVAYPRQHAIR